MMFDQTALVVEDDQLLRDIFLLALEDIKYDVSVAKDGQAALDWLAQAVPDLIVLDLHLPFASGEVILAYVEEDERFAKTRVMIVTADARMGGQLDGRGHLILTKPVNVFHFQRLAKRLQGKMVKP